MSSYPTILSSKGRPIRDLAGLRFGRLTVVEYSGTRRERSHWLCRCHCGNSTTVAGHELLTQTTRSCGCLAKEISARAGDRTKGKPSARRRDLTGKVFGRLTVLHLADNRNGLLFWRCRCICGKEKNVVAGALNQGKTVSCGCYGREILLRRLPQKENGWKQKIKNPPRQPNPNQRIFIYALLDPITKVTRYIGKTSQTCDHRRKAHIHDAEIGRRNCHSANWIKSLLAKGLKPELIILEECRGSGNAEERFHIRLARSDGLRLTNHTDGGEGAPGYKFTAEQLAKMSALRKGIKPTPEAIAKRVAAMTGRKQSPATVAKRMATRRRKGLSERYREHLREITKKAASLNRGKHRSDEHKRKMSDAKIGRPLLALRGHKQPDDLIERRMAAGVETKHIKRLARALLCG